MRQFEDKFKKQIEKKISNHLSSANENKVVNINKNPEFSNLM